MTIAAALLSLLAPTLAGLYLVQSVWPSAPPALRVGLGAVTGMAMTGIVYFLTLLLTDSAGISLVVTEAFLAIAIGTLYFTRRRSSRETANSQPSSRFYRWITAGVAFTAGAAFLFALDSTRHGGWDAFVMWNLRGRLIATSNVAPLSALFDPSFLGLHPDYPLLLPSLLARGWQYAGTETLTIPIMLASLFTILVFVTTISALSGA